jgi:opacity protein-like surface antigen
MVIRVLSRVLGCFLLLATWSGAALAEDSKWTFDVSAYLWTNETTVTTDTPQGQVDATLSFSDAISDLKFAFMGTVEAQNGPWSIIGDFLYFNLGDIASTPRGVLFSEVEVESKIAILSGYVAYRVYSNPRIALDVGGGFRAFRTSLETTFVGAAVPSASFDDDKNFVDPIVAARLRMAFNENWFGALMLDVGGLNDSNTWQALATIGYRLNDNWTFQGGYRYMKAEWDTDLGQSSIEFSGPILGVTYRF